MNEIINAEMVLNSIIAFVLFVNLLEIYVSYRQVKVYQTARTVPPDLRNIMDEETFENARLYGLEREQFGIFEAVLMDVIFHTIAIYFGFTAFVWLKAEQLAVRMNLNPENEIIVSCLFVITMSIISLVKEMPFIVFKTFVLEEKYGFNKQTAKFFIIDQIKEFIVTLVIITPVTAALVFIIQHGGDHFFIWLWLFTAILSFVLLMLFPIVIAPLFDNYTPLKDGQLKRSIEELAGSLKFPLENIYVVDGSNRSAHSNAYFYGLDNSKRIVLFDTLLLNKGKNESELSEEERGKGCTDEEVLGVLCHELGHWKLGHMKKDTVISQIDLFLTFAIFGCLFHYGPFYEAFGFETGKQPILVGFFIIMAYVMAPYNILIKFGTMFISRFFEYQADEFAYNMGYGKQLTAALVKTYKDNLAFPVYDWVYIMCNHTHPTLLQRLERIKKMEEKRS